MRHASVWVGLALLLWTLLGVINVHWADLNQDEGWYLYAAGQVREGRAPYRDFAFTQGPMMPLVYALVDPLIDRYGLIAGRWTTMGWGAVSLAATLAVAVRAAKPGCGALAGVIAFSLLAVNVYQSQFTTTVKTYALCASLLMLGCWLVQAAAEARRPLAGVLGGVFLALAAATRLSALVVLPVACLYLLLHPGLRRTRAWWFVGWGGLAGLAMAFAPFLMVAAEGVRFGLIEYHWAPRGGTEGMAWVYRVGFLSRWVGANFVAAGAAAVLGLRWWLAPERRDGRAGERRPGIEGMLWLGGLGLTAVHAAAPFPYDDYQVIAYPLFCAAIGLAGARVVPKGAREGGRWAVGVAAGVLLLSGLAAFSSPLNQAWALQGRDRIWWRIKQSSPLSQLRRVAQDVAGLVPPEQTLLTQDTYLAVEAGRPVPAGLELGPFSLFPEMSTERAKRLHVMNVERLTTLLRATDAPAAAFSGYGLAIASPGVRRLDEGLRERLLAMVEERWRLDHAVPDFGQGHTTLRVYRKRTMSESAAEDSAPAPPIRRGA